MKANRSLYVFAWVASALLLHACSAADFYPSEEPGMGEWGDYTGGDFGGESGEFGDEGSGNSSAGIVTAGEWNDLANWAFWSNMMNGQTFSEYNSYWNYYTNHRVAVRLRNENGVPQIGVEVSLLGASGTKTWTGRTNYKGEVNLWGELFNAQGWETNDTVMISIAGEQKEAVLTYWQDSVMWNEYTYSAPTLTGADILFIVDATGSMGDEIDFLKKDLLDILNKANVSDLRTGALFYRDEDGDEYVTRVSDMTSDLSTTISFIGQQEASGGGDYPEAVHVALEQALQKMAWRDDARTKIAFMLLDAPPHHKASVITSLHESNKMFAKNGIHVIPIAASGVDKNTEFFLRYLAMTTDGTYVFLTNHSGVGGDHIEASVGEYQVELLNELVLRLITEYCE